MVLTSKSHLTFFFFDLLNVLDIKRLKNIEEETKLEMFLRLTSNLSAVLMKTPVFELVVI